MSNVVDKLLFVAIACSIGIEIIDGALPWRVDDSGCPLTRSVYGNCVPFAQCEPLVSYIRRGTLNAAQRKALVAKYVCGSDAGAATPSARVKVCCPTNFVANNNGNDNGNDGNDNKNNVGATDGRTIDALTQHPNYGLFPTAKCGTMSSEDRIAFGDKADLSEFPWMALIRYETPDIWKTSCSGTLINDRYVLTAAHCLLEENFTPKEIILGEYDTSTSRDCVTRGDGRTACAPPTEIYGIESVTTHERYKADTWTNDIALIRLNRTVSLNRKNINAICLPFTKDLIAINRRNAVVAGWGTTERELPSTVLLRADLLTVPNKECESLYRSNVEIDVTDEQMCAMGGRRSGQSTCSGDSGAPLQYVYPIARQPKYVQHGIVSFRTSFCSNDKPVVFTRVARYMSWILDNVRP